MSLKYIDSKQIAVDETSVEVKTNANTVYYVHDGPEIDVFEKKPCLGAFITDINGNIVPFQIVGNTCLFTESTIPARETSDNFYVQSVPFENALALSIVTVISDGADATLYYRRPGTEGRIPICKVGPLSRYAVVHMGLPVETELFTDDPEDIDEMTITIETKGYLVP